MQTLNSVLSNEVPRHDSIQLVSRFFFVALCAFFQPGPLMHVFYSSDSHATLATALSWSFEGNLNGSLPLSSVGLVPQATAMLLFSSWLAAAGQRRRLTRTTRGIQPPIEADLIPGEAAWCRSPLPGAGGHVTARTTTEVRGHWAQMRSREESAIGEPRGATWQAHLRDHTHVAKVMLM